MKASNFAILVITAANSWVYLSFDNNPRIAHILQSVIAVLAIACIIWFRASFQSISLLVVVLLSGVFLGLSFYYDVLKYSMYIPLIYTFALKRVMKKYLLIAEVLAESIWMFLSIMFSFCLFGLGSYYLFKKNEEYFSSAAASTLTYLQVATLDQVGRVTALNYFQFGFAKSFGVMVASLAIFHTLFNINQAVIMQYVYRKRHNQTVISSRRQLIGQEIHIKFKIVRNINVVSCSIMFLFPFQQEDLFNWIILACAGLSTLSIFIQYAFNKNITGTVNAISIFLFLSALAMLISDHDGIFYLLCGVRIFLIKQILDLWYKIVHVCWELSPILSVTLIFFLIFSLLAYNFEKFSTEQKQFPIEVAFIKALQFMTLDDWTSHLRSGTWYTALLIIIYIIMLNHILLNAIISQSFGQLQQQEAQQQRAKRKQTRLARFQKADEIVSEQINDEKSAQQFWVISAALGYQIRQSLSSILVVFDDPQYKKQSEANVEMIDIV